MPRVQDDWRLTPKLVSASKTTEATVAGFSPFAMLSRMASRTRFRSPA